MFLLVAHRTFKGIFPCSSLGMVDLFSQLCVSFLFLLTSSLTSLLFSFPQIPYEVPQLLAFQAIPFVSLLSLVNPLFPIPPCSTCVHLVSLLCFSLPTPSLLDFIFPPSLPSLNSLDYSCQLSFRQFPGISSLWISTPTHVHTDFN